MLSMEHGFQIEQIKQMEFIQVLEQQLILLMEVGDERDVSFHQTKPVIGQLSPILGSPWM